MKYYGDYDHVQLIAIANGIADVNKISVGQVLFIPISTTVPPEVYEQPVKPPSYTSPPLVVGPVKPPGYDLPYTQPITMPGTPTEIPYTQPIALPALPPASQPITPAPGTTIPKTPGSGFDIWSYLPTADKKYAGLTVKQWSLAGVAVLGLGMLVAARNRVGFKAAANARRRK